MKFSKKLPVVLIASCWTMTSFADPITVYGKANVSVQSADEGEGRYSEVKSNASRFGIKGDLALDNDIEVLYLLEWQVDLANESGSDNIKSRNQYLGIKGAFGTVLLGRNDTMLKQSQGKIDQFSDYEGDIKALWKGENRMSDSVTYLSPKVNGFTLGVSYITEGSEDGEAAQSVSLVYGDSSLKKGKWFASVAADFDVKGYDSQRFSAQAKFDDLKLGVILHNQESVSTGESKNGAMMSAAYSLGKVELKGQVQTLDDNDSMTLGLDYKLGKSTKAYTWFTNRGVEGSPDSSWLAAGVEHKF
ncbi:porin [Paraglaciecola aestuariivivens]